MLTKEQKINTIYNKIARKDLSFGCRIMLKNQEIVMENQPVEYGTLENYEVMWDIIGRYWTPLYWWWITMEIEKIYFNDSFYSEEEVSDSFKEEFSFNEDDEEKDWNLEIIGHPVMIGDVISWIENKWENKFPYQESAEEAGKLYSHMRDYFNNHISQLLNLWTKKQLSIEEQSNECIDFIYNLISK